MKLSILIDQLIHSIIPSMYPAPIDRIFTYKEYFFVLRIEGAANDCIIERFYIFIRLIFQKSLINYLFRQLSLIYQDASSILIYPKTICSKCLSIVKCNKNTRTYKLHIEDWSLLLESMN